MIAFSMRGVSVKPRGTGGTGSNRDQYQNGPKALSNEVTDYWFMYMI